MARHETPHLTDREIEILKLTAEGRTGKEVASALSISINTVNKHVDQARLKLRALNRAHLIAMALSDGLIPPSD